MSLVKFGGGITEMLGSLGGTTFSKNKSGAFARVRKKPRFPRAQAQAQTAAALSTYTKLWSDKLTDAQRACWVALAATLTWTNRLGDSYSPSGSNIYVRSNTLLALAERVAVTAAPAWYDIAIPTFTLDYLAGTGIRVTSVGALGASSFNTVIMFWSGPVSPSRFTFYSPWSFLRKVRSDTLSGVPYTIVDDADVVAGQKYFFRFRVVRYEGQNSPEYFAETQAV